MPNAPLLAIEFVIMGFLELKRLQVRGFPAVMPISGFHRHQRNPRHGESLNTFILMAWAVALGAAFCSPALRGLPVIGLGPAIHRGPLPASLSPGYRLHSLPAGLQRDRHQRLPQRLPLRPRWCAPLWPAPI